MFFFLSTFELRDVRFSFSLSSFTRSNSCVSIDRRVPAVCLVCFVRFSSLMSTSQPREETLRCIGPVLPRKTPIKGNSRNVLYGYVSSHDMHHPIAFLFLRVSTHYAGSTPQRPTLSAERVPPKRAWSLLRVSVSCTR